MWREINYIFCSIVRQSIIDQIIIQSIAYGKYVHHKNKKHIIMEYDALLDTKEKCREMVNILIVLSQLSLQIG